jgi:cytochrome c biogenesis protein CcdA/glutaredoxin
VKKLTYLLLLLSILQIQSTKDIFASPLLRISKSNWNFGQVYEGVGVSDELLIKNSGDETLSLKIRSSCSCITLNFDKKDISPGESVKLQISYDTKGAEGIITEYLFLDSNDPNYNHLTWVIEGNILTNKKNFSNKTNEDVQLANRTLNDTVDIKLFSSPNCRFCLKLKNKILPSFGDKYGMNIQVEEFNLNNPQNYEKLLLMEQEYEDIDNKIPVLFIGGRVLGGKREITEFLKEELLKNEFTDKKLDYNNKIDEIVKRKIAAVKILPIATAGIIDGLNPCAFGAIIFLISYLTVVMKKSRRETFLTGISFAAGVFIAYFILGLGLSRIMNAIKEVSIAAKYLYFIIGCLTMALAFLSIRDLMAIVTKSSPVILKLPKTFLNKILEITQKHAKMKYFVMFAFITGIIVSSLELICTGQIYLPTITYMINVSNSRFQAICYLVLYSFMFIVPLLLLFLLFFFGVRSENMEAFSKKHLKSVKLLNSIIFIFFAAYMFFVAFSF